MRRKHVFKHPLTILLLICLIFIGPMIGAWYIWHKPGSEPGHTSNRGRLVSPAFNINAFKFSSAHGNGSFKDLNGRWLLVYINPKTCTQDCQKTTYLLRQIQTATGKNRKRIQRVMLLLDQQLNEASFKNIQELYPNMLLVAANKAAWSQFAKTLSMTPLAISQGYIYLVDPKGYLVLGYKLNDNPSHILKDLEKLLKVSQIG